jgi:hypothetical protein
MKLVNFLLLSMYILCNSIYARCDLVVINEDEFLPSQTRLYNQNIAVVPRCADLPLDLQKGAYARYCDGSSVYDLRKILYAPYNLSHDCKSTLLGTLWRINFLNQDGSYNNQFHTISLKDISPTNELVILKYPDSFSVNQ